ncbi:phosphate ABC transporter substrate-binding protein PstS [Clavibacter sp. Sh2141]|uniref:phosphate ABC transporter substrate-binding protein PstS n=1 Tax=Clavibacter sp. Sh2141 TaxID=3395374 RepID=UPI0039BC5B0A
MNSTRLSSAAALAAAVALALSSCASNEPQAPAEGGDGLSGSINGRGASSQSSAQEVWQAAFQTAHPGVTIGYAGEGSGAGRDGFMQGGPNDQFAGSDRALKSDELEGTFGNCADGVKPIDVPAYISPIAMIFQIDGVDELNLDAATAAGIFRGTITKWNDPSIVALNPDAGMPDAGITAVHRSDDSGTTENFADYLHTTAPDVWDAEPDGVWPYQGGEAAAQTAGVVSAVTGGTNTIGYADASKAGELGVARIEVGEEFVSYSPEAAAAIVDASPQAEGREDNDIVYELDFATQEAGVYPIVLISYLIACQEYEDPAVGELVRAYLSYVTSTEGQQAAADQAGSAPLSDAVAAQVKTAVESIE